MSKKCIFWLEYGTECLHLRAKRQDYPKSNDRFGIMAGQYNISRRDISLHAVEESWHGARHLVAPNRHDRR